MGRKLNLLVVDDDVALASNIKDVLEIEGYNAAVVHDGQTALDLCRRKSIDLSLIDIKLPDISGLELTAKLAELSPDMEAIIITDHASQETALATVKQKNVVAYEVKPLNMDHILALTTQIIERKNLEEKLKKIEQVQALIHGLKHTEIGIGIVGIDYRVTFQSQGIIDRFGRRIGKLCYEGYMGRKEPCDCCPMKKVLESNKTGNIEFTDAKRNYQLISAPFPHLNGTANRVIEIIIDITEQKYLEKKLIEYEEINKLKNVLLSKVSHELRTPLAIIKGHSTMLLNHEARIAREERLQYLTSIDNATDHLTKLVSQLLDMARLGAGVIMLEKAPTNISDLLEEVVNEFQVREPKHKIVKDLKTKLPRVNIDRARIKEVMDNLIDNACKYSREGTRVTISAWQDNQELLISISDQGIGIPADELERVFDQMYRVKPETVTGVDGLGLGLAICKGLVQAHDGLIWVESKAGEGSTFYFSIPI